MKVADEQVDAELEEEEVEESDLEEMSDSDDDEEEVEFDEDDVQEFEHSSRPGEKLFIDSEFRVWDDEQEVGTYNAATDTIF